MVKKVKTIISVVSIDLFHWAYRNWVKLMLVLAVAVWLVVINWPSRKVAIIFCSAGQGDETLIQRGFTQILIDGSRPGRALDCLRKHVPFFDRQIEMAVVTHPQIDHFGGLTDVVKRYKVMSFVYNGLSGEAQEWEELSKAVLAEGAKIEVVAAGDEVRVGELKLKVLWPLREDRESPEGQGDKRDKREKILGISSPGELNSGTLVMDFSYGKFEALFTSDIGEEEEKEIIRLTGQQANRLTGYQDTRIKKPDNLLTFQPVNLSSIDVLKVAHHGSKYSSSLDFLKAVRPALAVIEVGKNSYGHPTAEAIGRLEEVGAKILRTDQDGEVVVETDGRGWKVIKN